MIGDLMEHEEMKARFPNFASARDNLWMDQLLDLRKEALETALALDDDAFMEFVENGKFDIAKVKECIRKGTVSGKLVPIFCGSSGEPSGLARGSSSGVSSNRVC